MKAKKLILLSTITALTLLMSGCGDSASTTATTTTESSVSKVITVERGPLLGATVTDANGAVAIELGNGQYSFENTIAYPITSTDGYIDVNRNGQVDAGEVKNTLTLKSVEGNVVTLASTMASNEELKAYLTDTLHIDEALLHAKTPGNDEEIEALSDEMFKYALEHNITDLSTLDIAQMDLIKGDYETRYAEYQNDDLKPEEHERNLIDQEMSIATMDDSDMESARLEIEEEMQKHQEFIDSLNLDSDTDTNTDTTSSDDNNTSAI